MAKKRCFIIQPFNEDKYEHRYEDVFRPAIEEAQVEPYRVDRDLTAEKLVSAIEKGIKNADVCFAEITSCNRNVWYELGYATALAKPLIRVCEESCELPFDVRDRRIIMYKDKGVSSRHFEKLKKDITDRIKAVLNKVDAIAKIKDPVSISAESTQMREYILTALVIVASNDIFDHGVSFHTLIQEMNGAGFNDLALKFALRELIKKQFVTKETRNDCGDEFDVIVPTEEAMEWLFVNQDNLNLTIDTSSTKEELDNDIPF